MTHSQMIIQMGTIRNSVDKKKVNICFSIIIKTHEILLI